MELPPKPTPAEQLQALWNDEVVARHMQGLRLTSCSLEAVLLALGPFGDVRLGMGYAGDPKRAFCMVQLPDDFTVSHQNGHPLIVALRCLKECLERVDAHADHGIDELGQWLDQQ